MQNCIYIVVFYVKVGEVEGDAILVRGYYLLDIVFVGGIQVREGGVLYGFICLINVFFIGIYNIGLYVKNLLNIGFFKLNCWYSVEM